MATAVLAMTLGACAGEDDNGDERSDDTTGEPTTTTGTEESSGGSTGGGQESGISATLNIDPTIEPQPTTGESSGGVSTTWVTTFGGEDSDSSDSGSDSSDSGSSDSSGSSTGDEQL